MNAPMKVQTLIPKILATPRQGTRRLIAIAGAPASGKSTLADELTTALNAAGCPAQTVPMDGFHLDNDILSERGLLASKGAPDTFDAKSFLELVARLANTPDIHFPLFDRDRDCAIADAGRLTAACDTVIVEGNYLLFDAPIWRDLTPHWDLSIRLDVPIQLLRDRLVQRWLDHGLTQAEAIARTQGNDLKNAKTIQAAMLPADITV